jgi:hypothetical protein
MRVAGFSNNNAKLQPLLSNLILTKPFVCMQKTNPGFNHLLQTRIPESVTNTALILRHNSSIPNTNLKNKNSPSPDQIDLKTATENIFRFSHHVIGNGHLTVGTPLRPWGIEGPYRLIDTESHK